MVLGWVTRYTGFVDFMKELADTGDTIKQCDDYRAELVVKRNHLVLKARATGHTWRELATLLGMTENGLIKSVTRGR